MNDKKITSFIALPDLLSMLNASSGYLSILLSIDGSLNAACILMLLAVLFDSLDGWVARKTGRIDIHGFGKNMDSLSDVISFGVAPAILIYSAAVDFRYINILVGLLIVLCGILRLSRFNVLTGGGKNFTGLPIPVAAVTISSLYLTGFYSELSAAFIMIAVSVSDDKQHRISAGGWYGGLYSSHTDNRDHNLGCSRRDPPGRQCCSRSRGDNTFNRYFDLYCSAHTT